MTNEARCVCGPQPSMSGWMLPLPPVLPPPPEPAERGVVVGAGRGVSIALGSTLGRVGARAAAVGLAGEPQGATLISSNAASATPSAARGIDRMRLPPVWAHVW